MAVCGESTLDCRGLDKLNLLDEVSENSDLSSDGFDGHTQKARRYSGAFTSPRAPPAAASPEPAWSPDESAALYNIPGEPRQPADLQPPAA
jgi:hypothetical protein